MNGTCRSKPELELTKPGQRLMIGSVVSTHQVLNMARRRRSIIEAHLVLNGGLCATHWFTYLGKGLYLTEGIDGVEDEMTAREFKQLYAWSGTGPVRHLDYF